MKNKRMPVVFVGHGSPMNIILENDFTKALKNLGKKLPLPNAILVVSAHWLTEGTFITCDLVPKQIYDFYGFPQELYDYKYPAKGSSDITFKTIQHLKKFNVNCGNWGLDHASWAVLKHIYPDADIPVVELSLSVGLTGDCHYDIGTALSPLREEGVLIIGSGNIVHNLWNINWNTDAKPFDWAVEFDELTKKLIVEREHKKLIEYESLGKSARLSIPTNDHYLPMVYVLGLIKDDEEIIFVNESIQNASVSMRTFVAGL